jgi:hypothetical protein
MERTEAREEKKGRRNKGLRAPWVKGTRKKLKTIKRLIDRKGKGIIHDVMKGKSERGREGTFG